MKIRGITLLRAAVPVALMVLLLAGCHREEAPATRRTQPRSPGDAPWKSAPFYVLQSELTPATLVHSPTKYLGLFTGLTNHGLSSPTYVAWATMNGPRTFKRGEALDVTKMEQGWLLVWWAGAEGWTNWDSPWVVYLQHKPAAMTLNDDGLHLDFPTAAGDVVLLPLYGVEKPPQAGRDPAADPTSPPRKTRIKTWEWPQVLTRDPLTRIRYWGAATREIPLACEESVERTNGTVTLRSHFTWHALEDDWKTRAIKLAALAPPLARAAKAGSIRLQFSRPWFDLDFLLPDGPGLAVEGVDAFTVTLPALPEGYGMSGPRPRTRLIIDLETQAPDATGGQPHPTWPQLTWPDVRTPTGARWTFGQVKPLRQGAPVKTEVTPLGGNSLVTTFALP